MRTPVLWWESAALDGKHLRSQRCQCGPLGDTCWHWPQGFCTFLLNFALFLLLRSRQGKLPVELSTPGRRPHEFPSSLSLSYFQGQQFQKTINKPQALQSVSEHQTVPSPGWFAFLQNFPLLPICLLMPFGCRRALCCASNVPGITMPELWFRTLGSDQGIFVVIYTPTFDKGRAKTATECTR